MKDHMNEWITADLFETEASLTAKIRQVADPLLRDRNALLPTWLDREPSQFFPENRFVVCGSVCRQEIRVLAQLGQLVAIVDDELRKQSPTLFNVPVISTQRWIEMARSDNRLISCLLVATQRATHHFLRVCLQHRLRFLTPLQFATLIQSTPFKDQADGRFFHYGYRFFDFALRNVDALIRTSELYGDTYSRISHLSTVLYRLTWNPKYLEAIAVGHGTSGFNAYLFDQAFLSFTENEVYIDAGAFTGDSIEAFLEAVGGRFKHIYSFEPSAANNVAIRERLRRLQDSYVKQLRSAVTLSQKGVWSHADNLSFSYNIDYQEAGTTSSPLSAHLLASGMRPDAPASVSGLAIETVSVVAIDEATAQDATFIKYEVEGSEMEALRGSEQTIRRNRPKLAIAVYHKPEDLLVLPHYIRELDLGYRMGFRQHSALICDATYIYCTTD
ncbi:MAG: FkbM family methyltransferase [Proteobacteria bacterium]|nr:FkbM family methyltransferase [Pseudomonadota bacterium]